jgi:predicted ATPase
MLAEGLTQYREMGTLYFLPLYLCFAADAYQQLGRIDEGLATVVGALRMTETNLDIFWEAELHRLQGELTLQQSRANLAHVHSKSRASQKTKGKRRKKLSVVSSQLSGPNAHAEVEAIAEECFLKAIEVARQQSAKSLELRAVMSLARLWHAQGKRKQAQQQLAQIYGWFTEGFDTKDLQEAKALLDSFRA